MGHFHLSFITLSIILFYLSFFLYSADQGQNKYKKLDSILYLSSYVSFLLYIIQIKGRTKA